MGAMSKRCKGCCKVWDGTGPSPLLPHWFLHFALYIALCSGRYSLYTALPTYMQICVALPTYMKICIVAPVYDSTLLSE